MTAAIRKIAVVVEEVRLEMGRAVQPPIRKAAALAVIRNPFAGRFEEDLGALIAMGEELGALLAGKALEALGGPDVSVESYGKAALVGEEGELEHAAALLHPSMGGPVRAAIGGGAALIPSSKARGGPGQVLDIPLGHRSAAYVRSHFDGMRAALNDAPRPWEIVVAVALTDGGRPLPRVGGLTTGEVVGKDGLR